MTAEIIGNMRKALEAVVGDMEEIGHLSASTIRQVEEAQNSKVSTAELVDELRKRDGVAIFEAKTSYLYEIQIWSFEKDKLKDYDSGHGATIIRIMD